MNIKHLKLIRKSLDKIPNYVGFNLSSWFDRFSYIDDSCLGTIKASNVDREGFNINECGTVCCAIGWACQDPEVNKAGLTLNKNRTYPVFCNEDNWNAVIAFLECEPREAYNLFASKEYTKLERTPLIDVKERIDAKIWELSV